MDLHEFIDSWLFTENQAKFFRAYIEAVYFTDTGDTDQPESDANLTYGFLRQSAMDCNRFFNAYGDLIGCYRIEQAGHDFWLTRTGQGTGFWDRPEIYGRQFSQELTRAAEFAGESYSEWEEA